MNTPLIKAHFGLDPAQYPHVYERLAIDITGGLRSAEIGLRGFRDRDFLKRLWGGATGTGQELQAQFGQDLVSVQRATISVVQEIMRDEIRTKACIVKVIHNLQAVGRDIDELAKRTETLRAEQEQLKFELYQAIKFESSKIMGEIQGLRRELSREKVTRRLTDAFLAGGLYSGMGPLLASAHFLASIGWLHANTPEGSAEWTAALMVVQGHLISNAPQPLDELLLQTTEDIETDLMDASMFTLRSTTAPTCEILHGLIVGSVASNPTALRELLVAQKESPGQPRLLQRSIARPMDVVETLGKELQTLSDGDPHE